MNRVLIIILSTALISGCAHKKMDGRACGEATYYSKNKVQLTVTNLNLLDRPNEPSFYLFVGESEPYHHYAILLNPDMVINELKSYIQKKGSSKWEEILLAKISADLPLKENTDIEKYGLLGYQFMFVQRELALNLIEKNQATIIDFWRIDNLTENNGKVLKKAVVAHIANYEGFGEVCEISGDAILNVPGPVE